MGEVEGGAVAGGAPRPLVLDRFVCANCGEPIELLGWRWHHAGPLATNRCPVASGDSVASPQLLDVTWVRYPGAGSESYHAMVDEVEYVLWCHRPDPHRDGGRPLWSAWRTEVLPEPGATGPTPGLTLYDVEDGRAHVVDPRELTGRMPALVGYWLMDKVEPF